MDLDGTLARYEGWRGIEHIGDPIGPMLDRVKDWLRRDVGVKIFTARVSVPEPERTEVIQHIHTWCARHGLPSLEVTCSKDFGTICIWDDRAKEVVINTGLLVCAKGEAERHA